MMMTSMPDAAREAERRYTCHADATRDAGATAALMTDDRYRAQR